MMTPKTPGVWNQRIGEALLDYLRLVERPSDLCIGRRPEVLMLK
jgi:hypothetical protein